MWRSYKHLGIQGGRPLRILKTLLIIALYELSKEITYEIICRRQANGMLDKAPTDYEKENNL